MKQIELVIQNKTGLHARPAKVLVNLAKQFKSDISLQHGAKRVNAKSMVSVLTLGAVCGSEITVQVNGVDEEKAIAELEAAIRAGLGDVDQPVEAEPTPIKVEAPVEIRHPNQASSKASEPRLESQSVPFSISNKLNLTLKILTRFQPKI